ncbi:NAD-dependent epimerase/dehydratase family protein [Halobacteriovorax vibrionivorans]|uniref:NAD-dependent epimerase/dehydratase family protein n=1 Tax=Halobacteriovorax vibrionivorans TaxID=2152716 RepID=A0ABY0IF19_9BACT|nr:MULTISPECIES: NAD-dependent epimerase/dehydratase family protein [Halobacteriovorax]RZF21536.1 NAD-dependent epimerase/dehydratase family protein [Halobacteriovorax vibrionivorans]TGD49171.1 NAD-dependent epimerase/dehydratase family protein [Halobacteriovorax sp. Y22]
MKITIAGASGFIGHHLIQKLNGIHDVRGLGRSRSSSNRPNEASFEWRSCDLFSYQSIKNSLEDTDVAVYLVHSMLPSSKLFQGSFQDTDLVLADNFAKACVKNNVKQIVYLGGLVPDGETSTHLKSRLEVEEVFQTCKIPTTILRAGMIVGNGGSSFEILKNLVLNLPAMILPSWTKSRTQLVYIDDLTDIFKKVVGNPKFYNKCLNIVNGEKVTYEQLIRETATHIGKKCLMIPVPINYLSLSKWWVSTFGEAPFELVAPLVDSLKCHLPVVEVNEDIKDCINYPTYKSMLEKISTNKFEKSKRYKKRRFEHKNVRSIQRLDNPSHLDMQRVAQEYMNWLPRYIHSIVYVEQDDEIVKFKLIGLKKSLLALKKISNTSNLNRVKFHIVGGLLSGSKNTGWLEFRAVAEGRYTIVSVNEFRPYLPWYLYRYTQAVVHLWVMRSFNNYLNHLKIS